MQQHLKSQTSTTLCCFLQYASANIIFHFIFILDFLFGNSIPSQTRPLCLRLPTISMHRETCAVCVAEQKERFLFQLCASPTPAPPSLCHLLLLYLFLSESWFHLTWQSCGSHGRRCYKCSVTTLNMAGEGREPRQLSDAAWEKGKKKNKKTAMVPCLATACLTSTFISHFQLQPANCSASTRFSWPSFDAGEGEWAGGGRLATREGEGEWWMLGGGNKFLVF